MMAINFRFNDISEGESLTLSGGSKKLKGIILWWGYKSPSEVVKSKQ